MNKDDAFSNCWCGYFPILLAKIGQEVPVQVNGNIRRIKNYFFRINAVVTDKMIKAHTIHTDAVEFNDVHALLNGFPFELRP